MYFNLRTLILLLISTLTLTVASQCPPVASPCTCSSSIYEPIVVVCDNANSLQAALAALTNFRHMQISSLTITNTSISVLPDNAFAGLSVGHLVLNRNQLTRIGDRSFDDLTETLTELDLKDNALGDAPRSGVRKLKRLRTLILARNRIANLPPRLFVDYESRTFLSKIDLSGNQLASIDQSVFAGLTNLEEVSFEANRLQAVPTSALTEQRRKLKNLNLGLNTIGNVPPGALDFPNLESLSLEFNGVTNLAPETFRGVSNLLYLYITGNKFARWNSEMFRYLGSLRILGVGETPIRQIPSNAFQYTPNLIRLEMSEAAVDAIENGAFQRVPNIQAIIMNKNTMTKIKFDTFHGLRHLYTLDLSGNLLNHVDDRALANLPALRHLDISSNNLNVLPENVFSNTFLPTAIDTKVLYLCDNPWVCDGRLEWLRRWLRQNSDIFIDKGTICMAVCKFPNELDKWPLRLENPPGVSTLAPFVLPTLAMQNEGVVPSNIGWIILAVILAILLTSILLLAVARYFVSRRRKKDKEDTDKIIGSSASGYHTSSVPGSSYPGSGVVDLDLPQATTLYDRQPVVPHGIPYWTSY